MLRGVAWQKIKNFLESLSFGFLKSSLETSPQASEKFHTLSLEMTTFVVTLIFLFFRTKGGGPLRIATSSMQGLELQEEGLTVLRRVPCHDSSLENTFIQQAH